MRKPISQIIGSQPDEENLSASLKCCGRTNLRAPSGDPHLPNATRCLRTAHTLFTEKGRWEMPRRLHHLSLLSLSQLSATLRLVSSILLQFPQNQGISYQHYQHLEQPANASAYSVLCKLPPGRSPNLDYAAVSKKVQLSAARRWRDVVSILFFASFCENTAELRLLIPVGGVSTHRTD